METVSPSQVSALSFIDSDACVYKPLPAPTTSYSWNYDDIKYVKEVMVPQMHMLMQENEELRDRLDRVEQGNIKAPKQTFGLQKYKQEEKERIDARTQLEKERALYWRQRAHTKHEEDEKDANGWNPFTKVKKLEEINPWTGNISVDVERELALMKKGTERVEYCV